MKNLTKKILSLVVAVTVLMVPVLAFAEKGSGQTIPASKVTITFTDTSKVFNANNQWPSYKVTYKNAAGKTITLKKGVDYTAKWVKRTDVGSKHTCTCPHSVVDGYIHYMKLKITLNSPYSGTKSKNCSFKITKASQPVKFSKTKATVKARKLKKSAQTIDMSYEATRISGQYKSVVGKVKTFKKVSGSNCLTLTSDGDIKVKQGTKKGTYKIKIQATASEMRNYKKTSTTKTVTVTVK